MRINPHVSDRGSTGRPGPFLLALTVVVLAFAASSSPAKAAPVNLTFDHGEMTLGVLLEERTILPAGNTFPSPDLPTPQRTDIQLKGDLTDGQITVPASTNTGIQFPYMHLMHPIEQDLKIPITMRLNEPGLTGTWDEATGAMTLTGNIDLIVVTGTGTSFPLPDSLSDVAVPPLGLFARCRFDDVPVSFSTATQEPFRAVPFSQGFGKNGAMTTAWLELPDAASENGGDCGMLNELVHVEGGIWLSNAVVASVKDPPPVPTCETDLSLCPPPTYTEIDRVRLSPGRKTVKPGKKFMLTVRVHNSGNIAAKRQRVKIRSTNKRVKVPSRVFLTVPAGGTARKKFAVRVKRGAKVRAVIVASSNTWFGNSFLKIKSKPKHRR